MGHERPAKVFFLSSRVGAGHGQVARAVMEAFQSQSSLPAADARLLETLDFAPWPFRLYYQGGYVLAVTRLPMLYGLGFTISNRFDAPRLAATERLRLWSERMWLKRLEAHLIDEQPDVIVSSHFLAPPVVARLLRRGAIRSRLMVIVTDHEMHRWWFCDRVEHWFVPAQEDKERLLRWGVEEGRISLAGIPVAVKWTQPMDRPRILDQWRLPADRPILVLTGGTEFTCGPVAALADGILQACPEAFLVVLAGRNKKLLERLSSMAAGRGDGRLCPVSFTDRAQELVEACSLMITKAGGVTTAECAARGRPMVLLPPVPGQEAANARFFAAAGAAVVTADSSQVIGAVRRLLDNPGGLSRMGDAARRLYVPGTQIAAEAICRALSPALHPPGLQ